MILTCPECGTQYVVKDGAIPPGGRQVRCASCKHSWHQDPEAEPDLVLDTVVEEPALEGTDEAGTAPEIESEPAPAEDPSGDPYEESSEDPSEDPAGYRPLTGSPGSGIADERLADVPDDASAGGEADWPVEAAPVDDEFAPFGPRDYEEQPRGRRILPLVLLVLLVAAAAIAFWFLAPSEWKARLGIAQTDQTPLTLRLTHQDRQALASGNELLAISGRVINPTSRTQTVPPIRAQLRKSSGELVYSWTISPPAPRLSPGASATFNSAEVNVPAGADQLTVTLGAPRA